MAVPSASRPSDSSGTVRPVDTSPAPPGDDWTVQVAGTIESVVGSIRDKTTVPLTTVARGLVYGIVAGVMGIAALILLVIALVRVLQVRVFDFSLPVWAVYLLLGAIFVAVGLFLWRKRRPVDAGR